MEKREYGVEWYNRKQSPEVHALWRGVGLETQRWRGTGGYEEPVQPPGAMVVSGPGLLPRVMTGTVALPKPFVLMFMPQVKTKGCVDV